MLRAHKQAWAWQDEWIGLTIEDIRKIEEETAAILREKYGGDNKSEGSDTDKNSESTALEEAARTKHGNNLAGAALNDPPTAEQRPKESTNYPISNQSKTIKVSVISPSIDQGMAGPPTRTNPEREEKVKSWGRKHVAQSVDTSMYTHGKGSKI